MYLDLDTLCGLVGSMARQTLLVILMPNPFYTYICSILVSKKGKHRFGHLWFVDIKGRRDYFSVVHSLSGLFAFSALNGQLHYLKYIKLTNTFCTQHSLTNQSSFLKTIEYFQVLLNNSHTLIPIICLQN